MSGDLKPAVPEPLVNLVVVDYAGIARGRGVPRRAYDEAKGMKTCGWVPANMSLTTFDIIADPNPWGSRGDLRLVPDKVLPGIRGRMAKPVPAAVKKAPPIKRIGGARAPAAV